MPEKIYGKHHDTMLENYLNAGTEQSKYLNKELRIYGKNKSNYIFPAGLQMKSWPSMQGQQMVGVIKTDATFRNLS